MYEPPKLPPAGWYPDPHRPGSQRWWNGTGWDEASSIGAGATGDRLPDIGQWLSDAFSHALGRWRASAAVTLLTTVPASVLITVGLRNLVRDLVVDDDGIRGWSNDRLPVAVGVLGVAALLSVIGTVALTLLMLRTVDGERAADDTVGEMRAGWSAVTGAAQILPRAIGWSAVIVAAFVAIALVIVLVALAVGPLAFLLVLVAMPFALYFGVRLAFLLTSIVDRPGQPFRRTMDVTHGRWWAVFGRLLLLGLISWLISLILQTANSFAGAGALGTSSSFEVDSDGSISRFEVADALPTSPIAIVVAAIGTLLIGVLVTGVGSAALATLYRTRNPAH